MIARVTAMMLMMSFRVVLGQTDPNPRAHSTSYVLGPNDRVTVHCLNAEEFLPAPIRIDSDGRVRLPFVGRIKLVDLTVSQAETYVTARLAEFIVNSQFTLKGVQGHSQPVSVFGAVNNPGAYQLEGDKTLTEVLSMAGGLRRDAGPVLRITRAASWGDLPLPKTTAASTGELNVADIDVSDLLRGASPALNIKVKPFDVVTIAEAQLIYVVGQVRKPGGFTLAGHEEMTALQALSLAEGLDRTAAPKKARILRKSGTAGRQDIAINLDTILSGRAKDVMLQPDDVLFIPNNTAKSAGERTLETMIQVASGVVIYGRY